MTKKFIFLLALTFLVAACGAPVAKYQTYSGELPPDSIAVLEFDNRLHVEDMNGKSYTPFRFASQRHGGTIIKVTPGTYNMKLKYDSGLHYSRELIPLTFKAQAGNTYRIKAVVRDMQVNVVVELAAKNTEGK